MSEFRRIEYKHVHPINGEPLRFFVDSRTTNDQYLVDMGEYGGNGKCDCPDFRFKIQKMFDKFGAFPARNLQCWHIKEVLGCMAQRFVYEALERVDEKPAGVRQEPSSTPGRTVRNYAMKP